MCSLLHGVFGVTLVMGVADYYNFPGILNVKINKLGPSYDLLKTALLVI